MSAATKVTIAVVILFAAVLGIYYGFSGSRADTLDQQVQAPLSGGPHPPAETAPIDSQPAAATPVVPTAGAAPDAGAALAADPARTAPGSAAAAPQTAAPGPSPQPPREDVWVLRAPSLADPVAPGAAPAAGFTEYWVREGDSLWTIAQSQLGDPLRWRQIVDANPGIDADRLQLGARLRIPAPSANVGLGLNQGAALPAPGSAPASAPGTPPGPSATPAAPGAGKSHVIQPGDSLSSIARRYYGDVTRWRPIYDANRAAIGSDPDRLKVGTRLVIPS